MASAVDRLEVAGGEVARRKESDGQVGPRPVQAQGVEPTIGEPLGVRLQLRGTPDPRG